MGAASQAAARIRMHLLQMRAYGASFRVDESGGLKGSPPEIISDADRSAIAADRDVYLELLRLGDCPGCHRQLTIDAQCFPCDYRRCGCGRASQALFPKCMMCEHAERQAANEARAQASGACERPG